MAALSTTASGGADSSRGGMIKATKRAVLRVSKRLGLFRIVATSRWRRQRLTIFCYHGVSLLDEHLWNASFYVSPGLFERRMRLLAGSGYPVLPLAEGLRRLQEGTLPAGSVSLTFDDGMHDFYVQAHPILARYKLPVTVYLTTFYCDYNRPVFGIMCSYLLWRARASKADLRALVPAAPATDLVTESGRWAALAAINEHAALENLSAEDKDRFAERLARHLGVDYDALLGRRVLHVMSPGEASELAARGVDFQLHTHRHRVPLDRELFLREINDNRARIRTLAGREPVHFCYPSGVWRHEFLPWLREAGVTSATTCEGGMASPDSAPLLLPRVFDSENLASIEFEGWLSGISAFLPSRPRWAAEEPIGSLRPTS